MFFDEILKFVKICYLKLLELVVIMDDLISKFVRGIDVIVLS